MLFKNICKSIFLSLLAFIVIDWTVDNIWNENSDTKVDVVSWTEGAKEIINSVSSSSSTESQAEASYTDEYAYTKDKGERGAPTDATTKKLPIYHDEKYALNEISIYEQQTGKKVTVNYDASEFELIQSYSDYESEVRHKISGCHYVYIEDESYTMLYVENDGTSMPYCTNG